MLLYNLLYKVNDSNGKGKLAEKAFRMLVKPTLNNIRYTGDIPHHADFIDEDQLIMFEIKNCKARNNDQIIKFCYDMINYHNNTGKYTFGLIIHFSDDNFYDVKKQKISSLDNLSLSTPILWIPFVKLYQFNKILTIIKEHMKGLCNSLDYEEIRDLADKHLTIESFTKLKDENNVLKEENNLLRQEINSVNEENNLLRQEINELHEKVSELVKHLCDN